MKVVLLSSHGDQFYIGLNGFQIFDQHGAVVELSEDQLQATPYRYPIGRTLSCIYSLLEGWRHRCFDNQYQCSYENAV